MPVARPVLVSFSGLPGSGKSTVSRRLARDLPATWLRIDTAGQTAEASLAALRRAVALNRGA